MRSGPVCVLALLALAACGRGPSTPPPAAPAAAPPDAAARAAALEAAAPGLLKVDGHWQRGDAPGDYSAYFDHGTLRFVDEHVRPAAGAALRNRYYYEDGRLFYFAGEAPAGATGGGSTALGPTVAVLAEFAGARTVSAVRVEHYGAVKLSEQEAATLRRQGAELASVASTAEHALTER